MPSASPMYAFSSVLNEPDTALEVLDKELNMQLEHGAAEIATSLTTNGAPHIITSDISAGKSHSNNSSSSSSSKLATSASLHYSTASQLICSPYSDSFFTMDGSIKTERSNDVLMVEDSHLNAGIDGSNVNNTSGSSNSVNHSSNNKSSGNHTINTNGNFLSFFSSNDFLDSVSYPDCPLECSSTYGNLHNQHNNNNNNNNNTIQPSNDNYDPFKCLESIAEQSLTGNFTHMASSTIPSSSSSSYSYSSTASSSSSSSLFSSFSSSSSSSSISSTSRLNASPTPAPTNSNVQCDTHRRGRGVQGQRPVSQMTSNLCSSPHLFPNDANNYLPGQVSAGFATELFSCGDQKSNFDPTPMAEEFFPGGVTRSRDMLSSSSSASLSSSFSTSSSVSSPPSSPASSCCLFNNQHPGSNGIITDKTKRAGKPPHHNSSHCINLSESPHQREMIKIESPFNQSPSECPSYLSLHHCNSSNNSNNICSGGDGRRGVIPDQRSPLDMTDMDSENLLSWTFHHPDRWSSSHVLDWLFYIAQDAGLDMGQFRAENFRKVTGAQLSRMSLEEVVALEPKFGRLIYQRFQQIRSGVIFKKPLSPDQIPTQTSMQAVITNNINNHTNNNNNNNSSSSSSSLINHPFCSATTLASPCAPCVPPYPRPPPPSYRAPVTGVCEEVFFKQERYNNMTSAGNIDINSYDFDITENSCTNTVHCQEPPQSDYSMYPGQFPAQATPLRTSCCYTAPPYPTPQQTRRKPGRPKIKHLVEDDRRGRDKKAKNQHLWEFIHETLMNPLYNPQYLRWENQREGVFRFVQSEAVAQLWGGRKNNENMTYEKLSRAMRHYYKRGILERVEGRRLVYKFSIKAMDRAREKKHNSN